MRSSVQVPATKIVATILMVAQIAEVVYKTLKPKTQKPYAVVGMHHRREDGASSTHAYWRNMTEIWFCISSNRALPEASFTSLR